MTPDQIAAIIGLLMAFSVPPATLANVQTILEATQTTATIQASATPEQLMPQSAPAQSILIDTSVLSGPWRASFADASSTTGFSLHGTVDMWKDQLVIEGDQDIAAGSDIDYTICSTTQVCTDLGSPSGILGDYSFPLYTSQYANGAYFIEIFATDGGDQVSASLPIAIKN